MSVSAPPVTPRPAPHAAPRRALTPHLLHLASVLVVAALLAHLAAVLVLARHPDSLAFTRVRLLTRGALLDRVPLGAAELGPNADPALATAACLYDLGAGPVSVALEVGDAPFALLAVYDRHGRVLYGLTSRSASGGHLGLDLHLAAPAADEPDDTDTPAARSSAIRVTPTEPVGMVVAQVLAVAPSAEPGAKETAGKLRCTADPAKP